MNLFIRPFLISIFFWSSLAASSEFSELNTMARQEKTRKDGFQAAKKSAREQDQERLRGKSASDKKMADWEKSQVVAREIYRKQKKNSDVDRESLKNPEYRAYLKAQEDDAKKQQRLQSAYVEQKKKILKDTHPLSLAEELQVPEKRPRFDVSQRALYNTQKRAGTSSGRGGGTSSSPPPPPPSDFPAQPGLQDSFMPPGDPMQNNPDFPPSPEMPPPMPLDSFDAPPPYPMPMDDGSGGYFPPPPEDFGDFPPPEF